MNLRCNTRLLQPLLLFVLVSVCQGEESVLGCGGFIKASKQIDFSRINVQLLTKQGSVKEETDCAPNNGYFFVPVYEKGEYLLKVSPPLGWKFTPEEVVIDIDGETDDCSLNKDINFVFAGFGVIGKVVVAGEKEGPTGVKIDLLAGDGKEVVQSTETVQGGRFVFTAVPGSDHKVRASHPGWQFEKSVGSVTMTGDNGQAEDLVVSGFDVRGRVVSGSEPIAGVSVLLFGPADLPACPNNPTSPQGAPKPPKGLKQLCQAVSNSEGDFVFPVVRKGKYSLVPFYKGERTQYEVVPGNLDLQVELNSVTLDTPFVVAGFSVQGEVMTGSGKDGLPLPGVKVLLAGEKVYTATTNTAGVFSIERLETGSYEVRGEIEGVEFATLRVQVSPTSPVLPRLVAEKFRVSGQLDFSTVSHDPGRTLLFKSPEKPDVSVSVGKDGVFSVMLPADVYSTSVQPSSTDLQMGIVFAPLVLDIMVKTKPVTSLYFSPVRVTVAGKVKCMGKCPDLTVTLKPEGYGEELSVNIKNGKFIFQNQLPGQYSVSVEDNGICWKASSISFGIESQAVENLEFVQTGWNMEVHSTHETVLKYTEQGGSNKGELDIPVGPSAHCMPSSNLFNLVTVSCHVFHQDSKATRWSPGSSVVLRAEKHTLSGRVTSIQPIPDLRLKVGDTAVLSLTTPDSQDGLYTYRFAHHANPHEQITLEPLAAKFILNPSRLHVHVGDECQLDAAIFTATQGLFIAGGILPPLADATVTVESSYLTEPAVIKSDSAGTFSLGPFPQDIEYTIRVEKMGYVFTESTDRKGYFNAKKLASVVVHIRDADSGAKLAGVVVSLSGGENNFRTNLQTGDNGSLSFLALSPGQYFVKPLLKEYEFDPKSKLITVTEGGEEVVEILGKRVAFSVFGSVTGLKGDPEAAVIIEAVGHGRDCSAHQEEAATGADGTFRIRGLQPDCEYQLGLKATKANIHVERTIPAVQTVKVGAGDVTNVHLIALRPRTNMDVSLMVKVKKDNPNVKNIKARLFCSGAKSDSALHTVKLDSIKFVIFPSIPSDGRDCWITVEANAVQVNQRVQNRRVEFTADKPFEHHTVELELESSLARGEIGQASWLTLPLVIMLVTTVLQWEKVGPVLTSAAEAVESAVTGRRGGRRYIKAPSTGGGRGGDSGVGGGGGDSMSQEDIDKAVKYVEASTRKKVKPKKI